MENTCRQVAGRSIFGRFFFAGLLWLLSLPAGADQLSLIVNGKAIHFEVPAGLKLNEENWGAGLQYDFTPTENNWVPFLTVSGFMDSNNNPSYYAGGGAFKRYPLLPNLLSGWHAEIGGVAFLMTREKFRNHQPFLGVLPVFSFGTERVALNMTYIPKVDPKLVPILFLQLKVGLGSFERGS